MIIANLFTSHNIDLEITQSKIAPSKSDKSDFSKSLIKRNITWRSQMELTKEHKEQIAYEMALSDFFQKNYAMLLSTFLEDNNDKFMEHVEEKYEDHEGKEMKWKWVD